jgi:type II secretory pathway component GspD/PulD (secretin)
MKQGLFQAISLAVVVLSGASLLAQQPAGRPPRERGAAPVGSGNRENSKDTTAAPVPELAAPTAPELATAASTGTVSALGEYANIAASFAADVKTERKVRFHHCVHIRGETMAQALENFMTPAGTVAANEESDLVVISDVESNLALLLEVAAQLDMPVTQVLVEARIVEFSVDSDYQKEINLEFQKLANVGAIPKLPADSMSFVKRLTDAFVDPGSNPLATRGSLSYMHWDPGSESLITTFVRFLENKGRAKILSSPNLILRRGTEGSIVTGEEVPIKTRTITSGGGDSISTTFKSVGIKLRVTPVMIADGRIRLQINPEVSNVTRYNNEGAPTIAVRSANTDLEVGDGQLVSIGGLLRSEEVERQRRVPILSSIPLLGHLFRGTTKSSVKTQLVIFLRATVLADALDQLPPLRNLELPPDTQTQMDRAESQFNLPKPSLADDLQKLRDGRPQEIQPE